MKPSMTAALPEATRVLDDLRRIVRVLRKSSRAAQQRFGVSGAQLFVLKALSDVPALSVNALAARVRTDQSTVSVVVTRLVERGLVNRTTSAVDRRRAEVALTKRGLALLLRAPDAAQEKLIEGIERLPPRQRRALAAALHLLVDAMQAVDHEPAMFFEEETPELAKNHLRSKSGGHVR
jgi:DNA-binding MarR family transcriptional regulator